MLPSPTHLSFSIARGKPGGRLHHIKNNATAALINLGQPPVVFTVVATLAPEVTSVCDEYNNLNVIVKTTAGPGKATARAPTTTCQQGKQQRKTRPFAGVFSPARREKLN